MSKTTMFEKGRKCQRLFKLYINCTPKLEVYRIGKITIAVA